MTRERWPGGVPWRERYAKPVPRPRRPREPAWLIDQRRIELCGTADLMVLEAGGDPRVLKLVGDRRLIEAIRRT